MLENESGGYGEIIPATVVGKRIIYINGVQYTVDWPEDPRSRIYEEPPSKPVKPTKTLPMFGNTASFYDYTWGRGMFPKTETITSGGTGGGGGGNGDPPKQDKTTKTKVPGESSDLLSMPDLDKLVVEEVQRLTLSIIKEGKNLLLSRTVDYKSINYFPEAEVQIIPPTKKINFKREKFNDIVNAVQEKILLSNKGSDSYNYIKYLNLFDVQYNDNGEPLIRFKLSLNEFNMNDINIIDFRKKGVVLS